MLKQCKNCHADMPEEANICLECLTLCEERQPENGAFSKDSKFGKSTLFSAIFWAIFTFSFCFMVSELNMKLGKIEPADSIGYYESEDTTSNTNNNTNTSQPQQTEMPTNGINQHNNAEKPAKTLKPNSTVISDIKINPTTPKSNTKSPLSTNNIHIGTDKNETLPNKQNSTSQTTSKPNQSTSADSKPNTTKPTAAEPEYDRFQHYLDSDGRLHISKYTGNSKNVVVPDKIDGVNVYRIDQGVFKDNSKIETITFKDSEQYHTLWFQSKSIENCGSLRKITFPKNTDLGILSNFATNCQKLSSIDIDNWQYEFINGGLYYWNTNAWYLYYFCEGFPSEEFRPASFYRGYIDASLFTYNRNIKRMYLNEANYILGFYSIKNTPNPYLEEIYIDKNNKQQFDVDGVVFNYATNQNPYISLSYYSPNKKDKSFKIPENVRFGEIYNPYLEELIIPKTVTFYNEKTVKNICIKQKTKNLKTIKVQKGSPYTNIIKGTFTGTVIEY